MQAIDTVSTAVHSVTISAMTTISTVVEIGAVLLLHGADVVLSQSPVPARAISGIRRSNVHSAPGGS